MIGKISGVKILPLNLHTDNRGEFLKAYSQVLLRDLNLNIQLNEVFLSKSEKNVIRGMHFSDFPYSGYKLVVCISGVAKDVLLDVREFSETYGNTVELMLDASKPCMVIIPPGVAHGFLALQNDTQLMYLQENGYNPEYDVGFKYNSFGYDWGIASPNLSKRDENLPELCDFKSNYAGGVLSKSLKNKLTVLVTGGSGFIGRALIKKIVELGWKPIVVLRQGGNVSQVDDFERQGIEYIIYDGNYVTLKNFMASKKPDIVFHAAAYTFYDYSPSEIRDAIQSNITFGTEIVEAMKDAGIKFFVNTGTNWENYNSEENNPVNLYASLKIAFRYILKSYVENEDLRVISLKLFDTWGREDRRSKLFNQLKEADKKGERLNLSPGEQIIDLSKVEDICEAFISAAKLFYQEPNFKELDFFVSSKQRRTLRQIVEWYCKKNELDTVCNFGAKNYRKREVFRPIENEKYLPNWKAQWSIDE